MTRDISQSGWVMHLVRSARIFCALTIYPTCALSEIPDAFVPIVVESPFNFSRCLFNLDTALTRARNIGRPLYIYLGAGDCGPCREYGKFLSINRSKVEMTLNKFVVVDIRTWIKGPPIFFRIKGIDYSLPELYMLFGMPGRPLTYPSCWLITPNLRSIRAMSAVNSEYLRAESHADILKID